MQPTLKQECGKVLYGLLGDSMCYTGKEGRRLSRTRGLRPGRGGSRLAGNCVQILQRPGWKHLPLLSPGVDVLAASVLLNCGEEHVS